MRGITIRSVSMPKISIIMPVYGVEDYVGRTVESLREQTFENWELFAVDDGSPDRSGEILDGLAERDGRIKVIHKENGGAPSARNAALELATGEYVYFCDADDWAEPGMLADMLGISERTGAEMTVAGFYIDTYSGENEKFTQIQSVHSAVYEDKESFRREAHRLFDRNLLYTPWNKLFRLDYLKRNGLRFPDTFWDDFPFNLSVIKDISRVAVTEKAYYHFTRRRAESETSRYRPDMYERREEEHQWLKRLYGYWNISSPEIDEFLSRRYVERLVGCIENTAGPGCEKTGKEKKAEIKRMISAPAVGEALKTARPRSFYMKLMLLPVKMNSATLCRLEGSLVSRVKRTDIKLFAKLKAGR